MVPASPWPSDFSSLSLSFLRVLQNGLINNAFLKCRLGQGVAPSTGIERVSMTVMLAPSPHSQLQVSRLLQPWPQSQKGCLDQLQAPGLPQKTSPYDKTRDAVGEVSMNDIRSSISPDTFRAPGFTSNNNNNRGSVSLSYYYRHFTRTQTPTLTKF